MSGPSLGGLENETLKKALQKDGTPHPKQSVGEISPNKFNSNAQNIFLKD